MSWTSIALITVSCILILSIILNLSYFIRWVTYSRNKKFINFLLTGIAPNKPVDYPTIKIASYSSAGYNLIQHAGRIEVTIVDNAGTKMLSLKDAYYRYKLLKKLENAKISVKNTKDLIQDLEDKKLKKIALDFDSILEDKIHNI